MADTRARQLRKTMTPQEVKLWVHLRMLRSEGYHFRRQVPLLGYILDFACFKAKLIVELDGSQHNFDDHAAQDAVRDARLAAGGLMVLRVWNNEIDTNLDGVVETIYHHLRGRHPPPGRPGLRRSGHPPRKGEG